MLYLFRELCCPLKLKCLGAAVEVDGSAEVIDKVFVEVWCMLNDLEPKVFKGCYVGLTRLGGEEAIELSWKLVVGGIIEGGSWAKGKRE